MLSFINSPSRRAAPTLCALLFTFAAPSAHGFAKKPVVVEPPTATKTSTATATKTQTSTSTGTGTSTKTVTSTSTGTGTSTSTSTDEVIRARWETKARDGVAWSKHVFDVLPTLAPNLLNKVPSDIRDFCPAYPSLSAADRKNFWVYLVSSMAELESNHNPDSTYTEAFYDNAGRRVVSRGLLQISIESGNAYGCAFKTESELHDPLRNLDCGLRIMNKWIGADGMIKGLSGTKYLGASRYWSVLRRDPNLGKIEGWNKALRMCAQ